MSTADGRFLRQFASETIPSLSACIHSADVHSPSLRAMRRLTEDCTRGQVLDLCIRYGVPIHNTDGLHRYFTQRIPPGSFLTSILFNDLKGACMCADETNRHHIFDIVHLLCNEAPVGSWGSGTVVDDWTKRSVNA